MREGVAFGPRTILDPMASAGLPVDEMVIGGGASRSPLWMQIHADTAGKPVKATRSADAPALGSAILAAVGAEEFPDIDAGIEAMVRVERVVEPDAANSARYGEIFDRYRRLYPALKAWREAGAGPHPDASASEL